jgi:hypothetical protein
MTDQQAVETTPQGLTTEEFFYFFLRLRKSEIRRTVQVIRETYPNEDEYQLAQRLIQSKTALSLLGGGLINLPVIFPGVGLILTTVGAVGGTSMLTRLHLYLILEIALVFGKDIDDRARVREMAAVVAATGAAVAVPLLMRATPLNPLLSLPAGALSATLATRMIGHAAVRYYSRPEEANQGSVQDSQNPSGIRQAS